MKEGEREKTSSTQKSHQFSLNLVQDDTLEDDWEWTEDGWGRKEYPGGLIVWKTDETDDGDTYMEDDPRSTYIEDLKARLAGVSPEQEENRRKDATRRWVEGGGR